MDTEEKPLNPLDSSHGDSAPSDQAEEGSSSAITEETSANVQQWRRNNLSLQIPSRAANLSPEESVVIKMPPTPSPTPRRVNFSLTSISPGPAPPRTKSSLKNLIPKVGFKPKLSNTDVEKGQGDVSCQEKALISRSLSLSKLFTPRIKRTSSLPVTPIVLLNSESARGGSSVAPQTPSSKGRVQIARSRSVPVNDKEASLKGMDSFFRVIPSTPRVKEGDVFLNASEAVNTETCDADGEDIPELNPPPAYKEPSIIIPGSHPIVQHEILNNKRQILTKDAADSVKLWNITKGVVVEDFGKISFEEKKEELFEMVSIPSWFTVDTRLGCLSVHLETPQCFSAEMYSADLKVSGRPEDDKINLARETLKGLMGHWLAKKKHKPKPQASASGDILSAKDSKKNLTASKTEDSSAANDPVYLPFEFPSVSPPSIITEGSQGGPWRKKITEFTGTEDEKDFPLWCLDAVLNNRLPPRENTKLSFFLHPCEGSNMQVVTLGKLSAPRILRVHKVTNYVVEKMVLDSPLDSLAIDGGPQPLFAGNGLLPSGSKPWQKLKPSIEILCNNQVLAPEMSLATVRVYIWKKPEDLILNYRVAIAR